MLLVITDISLYKPHPVDNVLALTPDSASFITGRLLDVLAVLGCVQSENKTGRSVGRIYEEWHTPQMRKCDT